MSENVVVPSGGMLTRSPPSDDFNKYIQEMTNLIKETELYLMGLEERIDKKTGIIDTVKVGEPLVNLYGKNAVLNWYRTYLNPNTYMSMIKDSDTYNNFIHDAGAAADDLWVNRKKYGMSRVGCRAIYEKMMFLFFMALRKAETDKKYIYDSTKVNYTGTEQPKEKGWGGLF